MPGHPDATPTPEVAVVIPCFNDGAFLLEALASLEGQRRHEVVVVDDGSEEPETLEVLTRLRARGVNVVSQSNAGLGPARMTGVRSTAAPLVHFLDSDDLLPKGALDVLVRALDANPGAMAAWGSYRTFGSTDCFFPTAPILDPWRITYLDEIPGTCMVRRQAIEAVGGWDAVPYEDWDFWMKMAERGFGGVGVPETTLLYREHRTPRLLSSTLAAHDRNWELLSQRHDSLFEARQANRRRSPTPRALKLSLSAIDRLPLPHSRRRQLFAAARYYCQREMCSNCYRGPVARVRDLVGHKGAR